MVCEVDDWSAHNTFTVLPRVTYHITGDSFALHSTQGLLHDITTLSVTVLPRVTYHITGDRSALVRTGTTQCLLHDITTLSVTVLGNLK